MIALVGSEHRDTSVFATDLDHLSAELTLAQPTMIVAMPRVFENVFNAAQHQGRTRGRARIFDHATEVAIRFARQRARRGLTLWTRLERAVYDRLVYRRIRAALGGSLRLAFSGASPFGERLAWPTPSTGSVFASLRATG